MEADASAEKRLFISLLTRDIPLVAAFLDLIDNSINSAIEPYSAKLRTADDYIAVLDNDEISPRIPISLKVDASCITIEDKACGISAETASKHVFKFGRSEGERHEDDRLSVYGIGLKRAIFKMGNRIVMKSDHVDGGFLLDLTVSDWEKNNQSKWTFDITPRPPCDAGQSGTEIVITELYEEVTRRVDDGLFLGQLESAISRTYAYYLGKFATISVNGKEIEGVNIEIGQNRTSETFTFSGVTCAIAAGLGTPEGGQYRERSSGWFVFCNGRAVISADKSPLTGWASPGHGLPMFQPKHRPFVGTVFFVAENAERLPWTTTKSAINEDSEVWQQAKRQMASVGRAVISFLDHRYTDEGTEVASKDLQDASKATVTLMRAAVSEKRIFEAPKASSAPQTIRIQYDAQSEQISAIKKYLKRPSMTGSDVGRHTFN